MIQIRIDDRACVKCELCADTCPTHVFRFNQSTARVEVDKASECFGCLSCSEICPAAAITHQGVTPAIAPHQDVRGLEMARRLGADPDHVVPGRQASPDELQQAAVDLGLRLVSVAAVFKQTIGSGLPAVGTLAGRTLAKHLPRTTPPGSVPEALELVQRQLEPAWSSELSAEGDRLTVTTRSCFVRAVCSREQLALGGELCTLFTQFLLGLVQARLKPLTGVSRLKLTAAHPGADTCRYEIQAS